MRILPGATLAALLLVHLLPGEVSAATLAISPTELRIQLGEKATPVEKRAAQLFSGEVRRRTGLAPRVGATGRARYTLLLGTPASSAGARACWERQPEAARPGTDGFCLSTTPDAAGKLYLVGESARGVVAGVGKLLRLSSFGQGRIAIPELAITETPRLPLRGMYFASHFFNYYHVAPLEEVDRLIEQQALWGASSLAVWFDMHHFNGLQDPAAQHFLRRLKHFEESAHALGMDFGLAMISNEGYANSPKALRVVPNLGAYGVEICPSKPEGLAQLAKQQSELFAAFPRLEFAWTWAHDAGGCGCQQCAPWGGNGHLRASEQLARLFHERFPQGKVWTSTWIYDLFVPGEYDALFRYLREQQPAWLDGVLMGSYSPNEYDRILARPLRDRYPLADFPEISMDGMFPWGGWGANPLPDHFNTLFDKLRGATIGGWCYSEGIYEDLNKFLWIQHFWDPERPTDDILGEYAAYYLSPDCAADGVRLFHLLQQTVKRHCWNIENLAQADEAWDVAQKIDARLQPWARASWRWRLLYLRARLDHLARRLGHISPQARQALAPSFEEIRRIYHLKKETGDWLCPPPLPDEPKLARANSHNLAFNRAVQVSSTFPGVEFIGAEWALVDGLLADERPDYIFRTDSPPFWASDLARDKTPWILLDLGERTEIKEVRLQFRNLQGKLAFLPSSVALAVSDNGRDFETLLSSDQVPKEGAPYSPQLWPYPIGRAARYLRVSFGPSQRTTDFYPGLIELVELQVFGP
jgi:hypothetical protein